MKLLRVVSIFVFALVSQPVMSGPAIEVTDLAGRSIRLEQPAKRIVISSLNYIEALGILEDGNPAQRVIGAASGPGDDTWYLGKLHARWPETKDIALFGGRGAESVSVEKIISLKPDLAIFGLADHGPGAASTELLAQLEKAGIAAAFIDFRQNPLAHTESSIVLLGRLLGRDERAAAFTRFVSERKDRVAQRIASAKPDRPKVFLQAHVGRMACCVGMAHGMLGPFVDFAGGHNVSAEVSPGPVGQHTEEFLISSQPDVFIGTASGTEKEIANGAAMILLGGGVNAQTARASLLKAIDTGAMKTLPAWKTKRIYGIWHNFYNSPFNIYAIESFAKWFHPELFKDLDPEATLEELHTRFSPFALEGTYAVSLDVPTR